MTCLSIYPFYYSLNYLTNLFQVLPSIRFTQQPFDILIVCIPEQNTHKYLQFVPPEEFGMTTIIAFIFALLEFTCVFLPPEFCAFLTPTVFHDVTKFSSLASNHIIECTKCNFILFYFPERM